MENWKDVKGYEGLYQVSTLGNVRRVYYHKNTANVVLKPGKDVDGYMRCALCRDGVCKTFKVHRLVATAFLGVSHKCDVNHKNGKRDDNRVVNLEWVTHKENIRHSIRTLGKKGTLTGKFSENHPRSKKCVQLTRDGQLVKEYNSQKDAFLATGINHGNINACCLGLRKTAGGFVWKYKN